MNTDGWVEKLMRGPYKLRRRSAESVVSGLMEGENGCWESRMNCDTPGYPRCYCTSPKHNKVRISRVVLASIKGMSITGLCACHSCDNPKCVNPDHLWVGTLGDNSKDMVRKGRGNVRKGEGNFRAKLKRAEVDTMRWLRQEYGLSERILGRMFGVSKTTAHLIIKGDMWTD